jgi:hypothetical protein
MSMRMQGRLILVVAACALVYACGGPAYAQEATVALVTPAKAAGPVPASKRQTPSTTAAATAPTAVRARRTADVAEPTVMQRLALARCELDDEQETSITTAQRREVCSPPRAFNRF